MRKMSWENKLILTYIVYWYENKVPETTTVKKNADILEATD